MNSRMSAADIKDGLSNTAFVSEVIVVPGDDERGLHWTEGCLYQHNYTPNTLVPDFVEAGVCVNDSDAPCDGSTYNSWNPKNYLVTARSRHCGGVNLLLGDGSVRFVSNAIRLDVWQALCTPEAAPGEVFVTDY